MGWFSKNKEENSLINWQKISTLDELEKFNDLSTQKVVVFFKHSTRCSISSMAKSKFERNWNFDEEKAIPVYLDLLSYRDISNALASEYGIDHQSPQMLVIKDRQCVYSSTHSAINALDVADYL